MVQHLQPAALVLVLLMSSLPLPPVAAQAPLAGRGNVGEEIPTPAPQMAVAAPSGSATTVPAAEALLGPLGALQSGGGGGGGSGLMVGSTPESLGGELGGTGGDGGTPGLGQDSTPGGGASPGASPGSPPAVGGSEYDLVGTLFNGNAQAFTQAVLASGTSSSAIAVEGMLELPDLSVRTLNESLAGPEPGASAVARAVTGGWQLLACQMPQQGQDATAMAISGGGKLAAAAARGLARAAQACCSKVAGHLAGANQSLEASPSFAQDLEAALMAAGQSLPPCAVPAELAG